MHMPTNTHMWTQHWLYSPCTHSRKHEAEGQLSFISLSSFSFIQRCICSRWSQRWVIPFICCDISTTVIYCALALWDKPWHHAVDLYADGYAHTEHRMIFYAVITKTTFQMHHKQSKMDQRMTFSLQGLKITLHVVSALWSSFPAFCCTPFVWFCLQQQRGPTLDKYKKTIEKTTRSFCQNI